MSVRCSQLNFSYPIHGSSGQTRQVLFDLNLELDEGSRCILVGANGAGKSTLLRVLAGKHLVEQDTCMVLGKPSFLQTEGLSGISFLGNSWTRTIPFAGKNVPYQCDIPVSQMMKSLQDKFPERRKQLYEILEIDPNWRMHEVSDGQRRRVQIMLGLLRPFKLLLVDEMTVDLDALARKDFLEYLKSESEARGATIIYATHIFDGMDHAAFATHVVTMEEGKILEVVQLPPSTNADAVAMEEEEEDPAAADPLRRGRMYKWVVRFLTRMRAARRTRNAKRKKNGTGKGAPVSVEPFARRETRMDVWPILRFPRTVKWSQKRSCLQHHNIIYHKQYNIC